MCVAVKEGEAKKNVQTRRKTVVTTFIEATGVAVYPTNSWGIGKERLRIPFWYIKSLLTRP